MARVTQLPWVGAGVHTCLVSETVLSAPRLSCLPTARPGPASGRLLFLFLRWLLSHTSLHSPNRSSAGDSECVLLVVASTPHPPGAWCGRSPWWGRGGAPGPVFLGWTPQGEVRLPPCMELPEVLGVLTAPGHFTARLGGKPGGGGRFHPHPSGEKLSPPRGR